MSLKSLATRLALAFAAAKGVETHRRAGGMKSVKKRLEDHDGPGGGIGGMIGRVGGDRESSASGLGNVLDSLGFAGATDAREARFAGQTPMQDDYTSLFGGLATASGDPDQGARVQEVLRRHREAAGIDEHQEAQLLIRAMIQAAKADGEIDSVERQTLMDVIGESDREDVATVDQLLAAPVDVEGLARDTPRGLRAEVYTASVNVIDPDNDAELDYLRTLSDRLELDRETVNQIHAALRKPPLS
ncbi:DUF533 domain-containing protein [Tranquillimonas alkanivorans]|uniref:Uncharacterized protein n=1 Tax=Tranquillimonas alkanivorans TaxID=441119 RepID=A0A1I5P019_9RHOB|nr:DUF533 domain-containing protein [Tranquillimonas alkanivorans]SFP27379.1 Protein of unknown function [Tranquillimonas alkanivorans]